MNPQDISALSQAIQNLTTTVEAMRGQLQDISNKVDQSLADLNASSGRNEQKNNEVMSAVEATKTQVELAKSEMSSTKSAVQSAQSQLESKISDLKSELNTILRTVR